MKSAWDKIFASDAALTEEEREEALRELAEAVALVTNLQESPAHKRIERQIAKKMAGKTEDSLE